MREMTGLIGRDDLVDKVMKEARKGRHLLLTGPPGIGKSAVLEAVTTRLVDRYNDIHLISIDEQQAKGQFLSLTRGLLELGLVRPSALELDTNLDEVDPATIQWLKIKRQVNRLSIRDLCAAIIPAIHAHPGRVLIAVDDLTTVTPTMVAFWLAILDGAQLIGCASEKRKNLARLWWKLAEIPVPPLKPEVARQIAKTYMQQTGTLIEAPGLFLAQVVQQANGNPQALADLLADSSKERVVNKQKIREMKHGAGHRYFDFTPVMIVALASVVGTRYLAMGTGDTELYIFAGMLAAVVISLRVFLFRGAGKAN